MGGEIWLESELNKGSTFFVGVPAQKSPKPVESRKKEMSGTVSTVRKILVAEDEKSIRDLVTAIFNQNGSGYEVIPAGDGQEALDMVNKYNPDIVLLDIRLPKINGFEVCSSIKSNPDSSGTKVLIISGQAQKYDFLKAQEAGADGYIVKPFLPAALTEKVEELLNQN